MTGDSSATGTLPGPIAPHPARGPGGALRPRRSDIDWLRVLAMLCVFFFHSARFFDDLDWHIKNADHSEVALTFVGFLSLWLMPLLMLVAGAGSWFALQSKTGGQYILERSKRLLVPLYTVGLLVLIPPQFYWDQVTKGRFDGSFLEFCTSFFRTFGLRPGFHFLDFWSGHLWFLRSLFLCSLLSLPLLLYLRSETGRRWIVRRTGWCGRRGGAFLWALPIVAVQVGLPPLWPGDHGGAEFVFLLVFFLSGYLLMADARFTRAIQRDGWTGFFLGVFSFLTLAYMVLGQGYQGWQRPDYSLASIAFRVIASVSAWSWVVFFLSLASRHLNSRSRLLEYANEAVLPFYVLHQTVILAVGTQVVGWHASIAVKYAVIASVSFVLILALYELAIRRVNACRALFGMRLKKRAR